MDRYNFPENNSNPFDGEFHGNYFVMADKYSNLSNDLSDFNFNSFVENIPTGYKTIVICKRLVLIERGNIIKSWNEDLLVNSNDEFLGKFYLTSDKYFSKYMTEWSKNVDSLTIYNPNTKNGNLRSACWSDIVECKKYALKLSSNQKSKMIVSQIIDTVNWH
jgi:hypothetical protein